MKGGYVATGILVGPLGFNFFHMEPRGIASVLYLLLVVDILGIEGYERILSVIVLSVLISVFVHGISALPLSNKFGKSVE